MLGRTAISWTDTTWNPTTGCSKVSEGCRHCYAETLSRARGWTTKPWTAQNARENIQLHPERLRAPYRLTVPSRIFVNSMSDLFHEEIPDRFVDRVFAVMAQLPQHTFQVLTKRPERMRTYTTDPQTPERILAQDSITLDGIFRPLEAWPLPNVWLGTSIEDARALAARMPALCETIAAVRWISAEPLLGPLDALVRWLPRRGGPSDADARPRLTWVVVGGESGPGYRPMAQAWVREIRDVCVTAGVAFFYKQDAGGRTELRRWLVEADGSRWRWHQYPGDLRAPERVQ